MCPSTTAPRGTYRERAERCSSWRTPTTPAPAGHGRCTPRSCGHASTFDPAPGGDRGPGLRRAVEQALCDGETAPGEVDVVFADAAAVPELDRVEAEAISTVFGPRAVPVTAPKTMTGRLYSGAAPLDVATACLSIRDGVIPPTTNTSLSPHYDIDLVTGPPRETPVRTALVLARGYGGFNSAVVVRAPRD